MNRKKQKIFRIVIISVLFLGMALVSLIISRRLTLPLFFRPKAEIEAVPDLRCSLEIEVEDVQTEPSPIATTIPTSTGTPKPTPTNTPIPPTPTIRPTATNSPFTKPTFTPTPTLCSKITPSSGCPSDLPPPPGNVYPDIDNLILSNPTSIFNRGQTATVTFTANAYVKTSKLCVRRCPDSSYHNCDVNWGLTTDGQACDRKDYVTSLSLALDCEPGFYQLLVAGYSSDNNYACSSQLFYTRGSTADPVPIYCSLGTGCGCSNKPINIEIVVNPR